MILKRAGLKEVASDGIRSAIDYAKNNPHDLVGMVGGGGLAALGTYLVSRPGKNGRSLDQGEKKPRLRAKSGEGFAKGMARIISNARDEIADLNAKHPGAAAMAAIPAGAAFGKTIAGKLKGASVKSNLEKFAQDFGAELARSQQKTYERFSNALQKMASWSDAGKAIGSVGKAVVDSKASHRALIGAGVGAAKYMTNNDPNKGVGTFAADVGGGALAGVGAAHGTKMLARAAKRSGHEGLKTLGKSMSSELKAPKVSP